MPLLKHLTFAFACVMAVVWGASYIQPLMMSVPYTPQQVWFIDASDGRIRVTYQRVLPSGANGWIADARTFQAITLRDTAGNVVSESRDTMYRDKRGVWWLDHNSGNHFLWDPPTPTPTVELRMDFVFIPIWLLVALAMLPTLASRIRTAIARRLWARRGMCLNCGYDLRGTPERCPECGRVPMPGDPAAA